MVVDAGLENMRLNRPPPGGDGAIWPVAPCWPLGTMAVGGPITVVPEGNPAVGAALTVGGGPNAVPGTLAGGAVTGGAETGGAVTVGALNGGAVVGGAAPRPYCALGVVP